LRKSKSVNERQEGTDEVRRKKKSGRRGKKKGGGRNYTAGGGEHPGNQNFVPKQNIAKHVKGAPMNEQMPTGKRGTACPRVQTD